MHEYIRKDFARNYFSFISNIEQLNSLNCDCNLAMTKFQIANVILFETLKER